MTTHTSELDRILEELIVSYCPDRKNEVNRLFKGYRKAIDDILGYIQEQKRAARIDELNIMARTEKHMDDFNTSEQEYQFNAQLHRKNRIAQLHQSKGDV